LALAAELVRLRVTVIAATGAAAGACCAQSGSSPTGSQLIEVIRCGRPGSEMPHFDKYAFEDKSCYGLSAADLGKQLPPDPHSTSLTMREIEAVADYILTTYKDK
jgi:hypothetical protein